jgi:hypothetical protein
VLAAKPLKKSFPDRDNDFERVLGFYETFLRVSISLQKWFGMAPFFSVQVIICFLLVYVAYNILSDILSFSDNTQQIHLDLSSSSGTSESDSTNAFRYASTVKDSDIIQILKARTSRQN